MTRLVRVGVAVALLATAGCEGFSNAMTAHTDLVARAAGRDLTIDEAVTLFLHNPMLSAQPDVIRAVAELWIDYTLLAMATMEDSTLAGLDLAPLVTPAAEQDIFRRLREELIGADTVMSDEALREAYAQDQPGLMIRARHILLRVPPDATGEQRDSVQAEAESLRERALAGEDFATLAREHSDDTGSGQRGGDLGRFGRGQMVGPFEDVAFQLGVGEISEVVETPFGFHVIKVEEREEPSLESLGEDYRARALAQRQQVRIEGYVDSLVADRSIEIVDEAGDVTRGLARDPARHLSTRAGSRALATYTGGEVTAQEYLEVVRRSAPRDRARLQNMTDEEQAQVLESLASNEIVRQDAERRGIGMTEEARDSLEADYRQRLRQAARQVGLMDIQPQDEETAAEAVQRRVRSLLEGIIRGESNALNLGPVAYALRSEYDAEVFERSFDAVQEQWEAQRQDVMPAIPGGPGRDAPPGAPVPPPVPPDTSD